MHQLHRLRNLARRESSSGTGRSKCRYRYVCVRNKKMRFYVFLYTYIQLRGNPRHNVIQHESDVHDSN